MKYIFSKIIKEPVFLFFALGIILFILYSFLENQIERRSNRINVSNAQIELMMEIFKKTWNREPIEKEIEAQIENIIKDEVFFREAVAMGLDKSDPAIKRRLRQLMELMLDDAATVYPSEDQLKKYLSENEEKFLEDPVISFRQFYFSSDHKQEAENQLYNLSNNLPIDKNKIESLSLISEQFKNKQKYSIDRLFGKPFTENLFSLDTGKWLGPIESAYGWHLVYIRDIMPGVVPELADIWDVVEREWSVEQKAVKKEAQYQKMKGKYIIRIEYAE